MATTPVLGCAMEAVRLHYFYINMAATQVLRCAIEAVQLRADNFNGIFFKSAASLSHVELSKCCCYGAISCNYGKVQTLVFAFVNSTDNWKWEVCL